ncbi:MAG: radical SAM protein [Opitutus sp.]|nr:radical SAM protein [Opitutus sp.]
MDGPNACSTGRRREPRIRYGPAGIHVFDRSSGFNVLIDEIRPPASAWAPAPRQVSIALTNACDLACPHCFAPKTHGLLGFDLLTTWLDELDANGAIGIGFGGGEPTLYPKFAELCRYAAEKTGLAVTFTTHGHHLDDGLIAALRRNVHFVRISMDGVGATYESLRGRSFEAFQERIIRLKGLAPFGINYVVNSQTFRDLDAATALAAKVGAAEFLLLPEQPVGDRGGIGPDIARALQVWVRDYKGRVRLAISERGAEDMPTCNPFATETGLRAYAHIDAHGILKETSYNRTGVDIGRIGVIAALQQLDRSITYNEE